MKTLKALTGLILLCVTLSALVLPAYADVIVEPMDGFYEEHKDECEHRNFREYVVNTDAGHAYSYSDPEKKTGSKGLSNGEVLGITWVYTDKKGEEWGAYFPENRYEKTQWILLTDLTVVYDSFSFIEEHADGIVECEFGAYKAEASEEKPVIMWKYPGKKSDWSFKYGDVGEGVSQTYTDENGVVWGYIGYYMGSRNLWICITDPYGETVGETAEGEEPPLKAEPTPSEDIPTVSVNGDEIALKAEPTPKNEIPKDGESSKILTLVGALVGGVVVITSAVIGVLFGVNKKGARTDNAAE